jgi:CTP-dependent riboflavin kinase
LGVYAGVDGLLTVEVHSGVGHGDLFILIDYLHLVLGVDGLLTVEVHSGVGHGDLFIPIDYLHLVLEFLQELMVL